MTKSRIREIRAASRTNSAHQQAINELLATVEELQARTRRGEDITPSILDVKRFGAYANGGFYDDTQGDFVLYDDIEAAVNRKASPPEELPLAAKVNEKKKARGTREEIVAYAGELSLTISDALWFFEKMDENDWKVGKQPVKCWKGRMRTWKQGAFFPSQKQNGSAQPQKPAGPARCTL